MTETKKVSVLNDEEVRCLVREEMLKQDPAESEAVMDNVADVVIDRLNSITTDTISYWIKPKCIKSMELWTGMQKAHRETKYIIHNMQ